MITEETFEVPELISYFTPYMTDAEVGRFFLAMLNYALGNRPDVSNEPRLTQVAYDIFVSYIDITNNTEE